MRMKKLLYKLLIFLSPLFVIFIFILVVDPYNLVNISHIISNESKKECLNRTLAVAPRGYALWNVLRYKRNPAPNIILGNSKLMNIDEQYLSTFYKDKVSNLSIPGADYNTLIEMFWMAARTTHLKNVIFQTSFISYNFNKTETLFEETAKTIKLPYRYFLGRNYLEDTFYVLLYAITKDKDLVNWENKIKVEPWERSYKWITGMLDDKDFKTPEEYLTDLRKISEYCKKENINLIFVIPPNFSETRLIIKNSGWGNAYLEFKKEIHTIDKDIDLDNGLPISYDKSKFYDYVHLKPNYQDTIISLIFHNQNVYNKAKY